MGKLELFKLAIKKVAFQTADDVYFEVSTVAIYFCHKQKHTHNAHTQTLLQPRIKPNEQKC